ncbi:MAG: translation elongation factor Ts [bacterium]|jgi:elongation factor Ts
MSEISAKAVAELRSKTGAGMMDCKSALAESGGDVEKAVELLRVKGIAKAASKSSRATKEGLIYSYIHLGGKAGVLIEVNCETDFVARTDDFKNLCEELAVQVCAMNPDYVSPEDIPENVLEAEKKIYREQTLAEGKPEKIVDKIVEGKLGKYFSDVCLMNQPYFRDETGKKTVEEVVKETVAKLGENIKVARFARFQLGE